MTDLLEHAIARVRALSAERQDELAQVLLQHVGDEAAIVLTSEEVASFAESLAQAARGEFASEEQIRAVWAKYDP